METYLIAGLGNPEKRFENTRHNAGFRAVDALAGMLGVSIDSKKFRGLYASAVRNGFRLMLLKPQTYMNLSGESVREAAEYFGIDSSHVIVLFDDVNFDCGRLRVRPGGSAGGHNGIKSIISCLGSEDFPRVRIGVGAKKNEIDLAAHVLGHFAKEDAETMEKAYKAAAEAALCIIDKGAAEAMNRYNGMNLAPAEEPKTDV